MQSEIDSCEADGREVPLVLIADDDPTIRLVMRDVLERAGMQVVEAGDGREALERYDDAEPDVILLDVSMPEIDGFEVCNAIRERETNHETPICMVTGLEDREAVERAFHLGATDFISKPITWPLLPYRVRYLLRANEALNEVQGLLLALPDDIFVVDRSGQSVHAPMLARNNGLQTDDRDFRQYEHLFSSEHQQQAQLCVCDAIESGEPQVYEHLVEASGENLETRFVGRDRNSALAIVRNITERKDAESQIYDLAFYDRLTGLPNRHQFNKELDEIIWVSTEMNLHFAILFVDLDRFKRINDTLGHSMGDELLKSVAKRLEKSIRTSDAMVHVDKEADAKMQLARLGGDEFVIVLRHISSQTSAATVASRIVNVFAEPIPCGMHQFVVTPSIGIAYFPDDGVTREDLLMSADSAMYKAKAAGRNNFKFFTDTMKTRSLRRLDIEIELRQAVEDQAFELFYQPKIDLKTGMIIGAEALLRWRHAELGWVSPAEFISIAEESGLIRPLGQWVLNDACQQIASWQGTELEQLSVAVNVSSEQMYADDFSSTVTDSIKVAGIQPHNLEIEITESMLMRDIDENIAKLKELKTAGIGVSVDDFGTGYSSLSYLKRLPIDALKIDRSFVRDLHEDSDDAAICAAVIAMARQLDLKVVAEGVETDEQLEFLIAQGCDLAQGYLLGEPLPVAEFETYFNAQANHASKAVRN